MKKDRCFPLNSFRLWMALMCCVVLIPQMLFGEFRTWTSMNGDKIEARMVRQWLDTIYLEDRNGNEFQITIRNLSEADQQFAQSKRTALPSRVRDKSSRTSPARIPEPIGLVYGDPELAKLMIPGQIIGRKVEGEHDMSYEIFTPAAFDPQNPPPIMILFHPGGNGRAMLNPVRNSADQVGWIAVGVNRLANRMEGAVREMEDEVLADIFARIPHNGDRVYLGGFSGGALRAFGITSRYLDQRPFAGVLSYGGWLGGDEGRKRKFPRNMTVAIVNGDEDAAANYHAEMDKSALSGSGRTVRIFSFSGGHAIAPAEVTTDVLKWMQSEAER